MEHIGRKLIEQAAQLAAHTEDAPQMTRLYLSRQHRGCGDLLVAWMTQAGMDADFDALGNVVGRYAGTDPAAPVLMLGSHLDTVRNAGRYDGMLGVLSAIACVDALHRRGRRFPGAIEVIAFGDEEGVRFGVTMIGSAAMAGRFRPDWLEKTDRDGVTMRAALLAFGCDPDGWPALTRDFSRVRAYAELHIEQGPVLLEAGLPAGIVSAIAGSTRVMVDLAGRAGHAGTVPMNARRDALAAAAEMVLAGESVARDWPTPLVCTSGKLDVSGGAINVIPGKTAFTFDVRSGDDVQREAAVRELRARCEAIAARREVGIVWQTLLELPAAPCDAALRQTLAGAFAAESVPVTELASGAGHDAMSFSGRTPIAMLFLRCGNGGISHHPDETVDADDVEVGVRLFTRFIEMTAHQDSPS
ncbi:MAG: allantoate amidohydrolase [Janthinobacterium lividum]